jgi:hypothetical protein
MFTARTVKPRTRTFTQTARQSEPGAQPISASAHCSYLWQAAEGAGRRRWQAAKEGMNAA